MVITKEEIDAAAAYLESMASPPPQALGIPLQATVDAVTLVYAYMLCQRYGDDDAAIAHAANNAAHLAIFLQFNNKAAQ